MWLGRTLFWLFTVFAALTLLWVVSDLFFDMSNSYPPTLDVTGSLLASAIWAVGWLCRLAF
jgi:hypothetical protein